MANDTATTTAALERDVDLTSYDLIVVNSSSGKDSLATLASIAQAAQAQGVLDRVHVVHADLGRAEWQGTKELAARQAAHYGVPADRFHVIARPQGDLLDQIEARGMWPSSNARYCTSDQKRGQIAKVINCLAREHSAPRPSVLNVLGIRAAESPARAKKSPWQANKRLTNGRKLVVDWYPVFHWSEADVWATCNQTPALVHVAYSLGMPRLSCVFCVFAPKAALVIAAKANPELAERYVQLEQRMGHTFRQDLTMADVQAAAQAGDDCGPVVTWEM